MTIRSFHRSLALLSALPLVVIFATGVILSLSPKIEWLQPHSPKLNESVSLTFDQILAIAQKVPEAQIHSWTDVAQIDARPSTGVVRVRALNYWEIQINGKSGEVIKVAPRWKTLLVELHEGSWFTSWSRTWIFFPTGLCALALWFSGVWLWLRRPRKRKS